MSDTVRLNLTSAKAGAKSPASKPVGLYPVLILGCLTLLTTTACPTTQTGVTPPPTTADSHVGYRMSGYQGANCTVDVRWTWTPVYVNGPGRATSYQVPPTGYDHKSISSQNVGGTTPYYVCEFDALALGLAAGTWDVAVISANGTLGQARVTLRTGANWVAFTEGRGYAETQGASGFNYP
jgi:hypothetical protein